MICICAILYSTDKENWIKIFKNQSKNTSDINDQNQGANYPGSQIESVIALLILDFIKQREAKPESASTEATKKTE
jgi:hypothetical protein